VPPVFQRPVNARIPLNFLWGYKMSEQVFTFVAAARDIEEKSFSIFKINGTGIVICRFRDEYFAIENRCSHALETFDEGRMRGYRIMCPMHGATFDIRDGSCTGAPANKPIRSFPLRIVDGKIEVALPVIALVD
jgi:3-phenylpropionate/trans-cinnamate dioxygenase ferredoxin subunit